MWKDFYQIKNKYITVLENKKVTFKENISYIFLWSKRSLEMEKNKQSILVLKWKDYDSEIKSKIKHYRTVTF